MQAFHHFDGRSIVVEGAGGLLVPIDARRNVLDLIAALGLPVLLVARAGLGTLNHTGLSLRALFARDISVRSVLLSCGTSVRDPSERDNAAWIGRLFSVRVLGPVAYQRNGKRRREAFRQALRPLLAKRRQTEGAIADEMPRVRAPRSAKPPR